MSTRRISLIAGAVVLVVVLVLASLSLADWSAPQGKASAAPLTGPTVDAAERAKADLAARLGISAGKITTVSSEAHTWGDTSLGLPEPGMMYAQVMTDGYIITLSVDSQTYVYHVAGEAVKLNPDAK